MRPETEIEKAFQDSVSAEVRLHPDGLGRYRVVSPFMFDDGDHLSMVVKRDGQQWVLSDEGYTFMHLSYELDDRDLQGDTRRHIIENALRVFGLEDRDGELVAPLPDGRYGDALYSFVQGLLRISDVTYLSREWVRSTFMDDLTAFLAQTVPGERCSSRWHDPVRDPQARYAVDWRINGAPSPLFVYGLVNDDHVRDAHISLLQFRTWQIPFRSLGIFENQEEISRRVLARFTDVCDRQFSSLGPNRQRIAEFLHEAVGL